MYDLQVLLAFIYLHWWVSGLPLMVHLYVAVWGDPVVNSISWIENKI